MRVDCFSRIAVMSLTLATLSPGLARADCGTRHFYNNSSQPFTLEMGEETGSTCSYADSGMVKVCVIPPGQVGDIHYANNTLNNVAVALHGDAIPPGGHIYIKSNDGGKIYDGGFMMTTDTCGIIHSGSTGNISVNEPANGDISTCGKNGWSCKSLFGEFIPH